MEGFIESWRAILMPSHACGVTRIKFHSVVPEQLIRALHEMSSTDALGVKYNRALGSRLPLSRSSACPTTLLSSSVAAAPTSSQLKQESTARRTVQAIQPLGPFEAPDFFLDCGDCYVVPCHEHDAFPSLCPTVRPELPRAD
eukprot:2120065-Amphidinium_carterae.2